MNTVQKIETFLKAHSAGQDKSHGITVTSTDNPGWWVKIDIRNTPLEHKLFTPVRRGVVIGNAEAEPAIPTESLTKTTLGDGTIYRTRKDDWIDCEVKEGIFNGAGDTSKLDEILGIFITWAGDEHFNV